MKQIAPSLLAADFADLTTQISSVENADMLHIDVMDGHFVPNIAIGVPTVRSIRKITDMFFDVHLMVEDPLFYSEVFINAGADLISFHIESDCDSHEVIRHIKSKGKKAAVALRPMTDIQAVAEFIAEVDMVLVMAVEPGFGGQEFMPEVLDKIKQVAEIRDRCNTACTIQVDGGINLETAKLCADAGADILVAGAFVFGHENPRKCVENLKNVIKL